MCVAVWSGIEDENYDLSRLLSRSSDIRCWLGCWFVWILLVTMTQYINRTAFKFFIHHIIFSLLRLSYFPALKTQYVSLLNGTLQCEAQFFLPNSHTILRT